MKTFRMIGMAAVAVLLAFSFAACSDDDDNGGSNSSSGKKLVQWCWGDPSDPEDADFTWTVSYNSSGKLQSLTSPGSYDLYYAWGTNSLVETVKDKEGYAYTVTYTLSNGLATKAVRDDGDGETETITYSYDSSNRLIGTEHLINYDYDDDYGYVGYDGPYTSKITWENDVPVKQEFTYTSGGTETRTLEYGDQTCSGYNPAIMNYKVFLRVSFSDDDVKVAYTNPEMFGMKINKLPVKETTKDSKASGETDTYTSSYTYTFDGDGYVSAIYAGGWVDWTYVWK
ncbi:MAG: hypothetical protein LUC22_06430 [Prevotella sp.]|nr:hypothetical protein [Prevotella sp.]